MPILYSCRIYHNTFRIVKWDNDWNVVTEYYVYKDWHGQMKCTCPAGPKGICKHLTMVNQFIGNHHLGDGWLLNPITDEFEPPFTSGLRRMMANLKERTDG